VATNAELSRAFAVQAISDRKARDLLAQANTDTCHEFHYLQMAAEKTCKAFAAQKGEVL